MRHYRALCDCGWVRTYDSDAKARGWLPPLALDDDHIDDPTYDPLARESDEEAS